MQATNGPSLHANETGEGNTCRPCFAEYDDEEQHQNMDVEAGAGAHQYLTGYPSLAAFIASDRDQTSAIFKRFKRLGARNLLHLQSELAELESRQDELDDEANRCQDLSTKQFLRNWPEFCLAASSDGRMRERKELAETIKATVKEYSTLSIHHIRSNQ